MGKNTLSLRTIDSRRSDWDLEREMPKREHNHPNCPDCREELQISAIPDEGLCPVCGLEFKCWFGKWRKQQP